MTRVGQMVRTNPSNTAVNADTLVECIGVCFDCAGACRRCEQACSNVLQTL